MCNSNLTQLIKPFLLPKFLLDQTEAPFSLILPDFSDSLIELSRGSLGR
jgi:hypothetical protein